MSASANENGSANGNGSARREPPVVELYDTTLRDGAQRVGLSYTTEDRMRILHKLDELGFPYVEGGWPGANARDTEFYRLATREPLRHATLTAFGMTRRAGERAEDSAVLRDLLDAGTEVVCVVGKSWDRHVTEALRTILVEGVSMVYDSIRLLTREDRRVFFDAEHFFDGYRRNPAFALTVLRAAEDAGAERIVLCDTNGGALPTEIGTVLEDVARHVHTPLGVHFHNDAGCAVANSILGVKHGALQIQGTVNGYGERCGNADLVAVAGDLALKLGSECLPRESIARLSELSHVVAEVANVAPDPHQPYAGRYAFTHKAGLHASAIARRQDAYEHVSPTAVGNTHHVVASDLGGRANVVAKAKEFGVDVADDELARVLGVLKDKETRGYTFEVADASLELLLRRNDGWRQPFFEVESFRATIDKREDDGTQAEATVKVRAEGQRRMAAAEGHGPVSALDNALRLALEPIYPQLADMTLMDYRVRVLDEKQGTAAVVRVLIDTSDGEKEWTTVGVSENVIEASWEALVDSLLFGLLHPRADRVFIEGVGDLPAVSELEPD
ncbi:MAG: citramalate synthase [Actinomycetota bacterium]